MANPDREFEPSTNEVREARYTTEHGVLGNFRINIFRQRNTVGMVIRFVKPDVPAFDTLGLPPILKGVIMEKLGLILVVGSTGSGKSTTMASMIDFRNSSRSGHILTVEDPIEFAFRHKKSIVNQREVRVDTLSYQDALISACRAPDFIMIGEIRDHQTLVPRVCLPYRHLCISAAATTATRVNRMIISFRATRRRSARGVSSTLLAVLATPVKP